MAQEENIVGEITEQVISGEITEQTIEVEVTGGLQGEKGETGTDGTDGTDGNTILNGVGAPDNGLGVDGDFYLDTSTSELYGAKAGGVWPTPPTSLVGAKGDKGDAGDPALLARSEHTLAQGESVITHTSALINTAVYMNGYRLLSTDYTLDTPSANQITLVVPVQAVGGASIVVETSN